MRELFADLSDYSQGYTIPIDTLAHKPANWEVSVRLEFGRK
jgi:hypothetical protein